MLEFTLFLLKRKEILKLENFIKIYLSDKKIDKSPDNIKNNPIIINQKENQKTSIKNPINSHQIISPKVSKK
jgi:hypothetical protein